jgi:hypothetical protein
LRLAPEHVESGTIAAMIEPTTATATPDILATGDALATAGRWAAALASWEDAARRDPSVAGAVEDRVTWFLDETGTRRISHRQLHPAWILTFLLATLCAAGFVAIAGTPGSAGANLWAVAAWIMIVVAAVASVIGARERSRQDVHRLFQRATQVARQREADMAQRNGET